MSFIILYCIRQSASIHLQISLVFYKLIRQIYIMCNTNMNVNKYGITICHKYSAIYLGYFGLHFISIQFENAQLNLIGTMSKLPTLVTHTKKQMTISVCMEEPFWTAFQLPM